MLILYFPDKSEMNLKKREKEIVATQKLFMGYLVMLYVTSS